MTKRLSFDHLAGIYQRYRPPYPSPLLEHLRAAVLADRAVGAEALLVDVGAGTGISTRLLREVFGAGPRVVGVEPSPRMRAEARRHTPPELDVDYCEGWAERLPLGASTVRVLVAAQAAHWFDRPLFYAEARRVLEPGGVLALLYNNRQWAGSALLEAYERYLEAHSPSYTRGYRTFPFAEELAGAGFRVRPRFATSWTRVMSHEEFIGMCLSSTKADAVVQREGREAVEAALRALLERYAPDPASVRVPYVSEAVIAVWAGPRIGA